MKTRKNIIYRAVSPDGEEYIGRTMNSLAQRKAEHIANATNPLHKAILKHGDKMRWEVIAEGERQAIADEELRLIKDRKPALNRVGRRSVRRAAETNAKQSETMKRYHSALSPEERAARGAAIREGKLRAGAERRRRLDED